MFDLIIRNGTVVLPELVAPMDIAVRDDRIAAMAELGRLDPAANEIDAHGLMVMPGLIDAHVHVNLPLGEFTTKDKFGDITRAAAFGGTTLVIDFAIPDPGISPLEGFKRKHDEAVGDSYVDFALHGCITRGAGIQDIPQLIERGASSIKVFMVYKDRLMLSHGEIREVMHSIAANSGAMFIHAENPGIIDYLVEQQVAQGNTTAHAHLLSHPNVSESSALSTVVNLVEETRCPTYFVHVTCAEARDILRNARDKALPVRAETCPHYLSLNAHVYSGDEGEKFVCSPPVRSQRDSQALWEMIQDGLIHTVNSDHCGYDSAQKAQYRDDFTKMPNGLPGVETRNLILFSEGVGKGRISAQDFVALTSTNAARMLGIYPRKGTIAIGSDADLVLYDPDVNWTLHSEDFHMNTDYTPFEGFNVQGKPSMTIVRGEVVMRDGQLVGSREHGQFVKTASRW
jgi:dihydropyrimidinase